MENCRRYEFWIIRFYNEISGADAEQLEDIPPRALVVIMTMTHNDRVRPFILNEIRAGMKNRRQLATKYEVSEGFVRHLGRIMKVLV